MINNPQEISLCELTTMIKRGISPAYAENGIPVFNQRCIRDSIVNLDLRRRTDPEKRKIADEKLVRLWDVLVNSTGVGTLGRVAQIKKNVDISTVDSHVTIVRPDLKKVDGQYFGYAINAKQSNIEAMGEGATGQTELSRVRLGEEIAIPLPPILTQRKISYVLSAYDNLIENNTRRIQILEEMAQRIYKEWFVDFKYPGHENDKLVDSELGMIPESWEVKRLDSFVSFDRGVEPGSKNYLEMRVEGSVPFLRVGDLGNRNKKIFIYVDLAKNKLLKYDDIVISMDGTVGIVKTGLEGCFSTGIRKCNIIDDYINSPYLYYTLKSKNIQSTIKAHATGSTILHASSSIKHIKIALCPKNTMESFFELVNPIYLLKKDLKNKNENLLQTRNLLLPKLISGKVDVSDLDIDTSILDD